MKLSIRDCFDPKRLPFKRGGYMTLFGMFPLPLGEG